MLSKIYTPKQIEILKACRNSDWFMLINHGAKRSGKTQLDNELFLAELRKVRQTADQLGIDTPQYILAGYSLGNIQDNILTELSNKYGFEFKFDKYNNFNLFGVKVIQTSHGSISGLGRIPGMTAFGAYINEASLANQEVFDEIKARCSGKGARIIADTNPDHPEHWLLKDLPQQLHCPGAFKTVLFGGVPDGHRHVRYPVGKPLRRPGRGGGKGPGGLYPGL